MLSLSLQHGRAIRYTRAKQIDEVISPEEKSEEDFHYYPSRVKVRVC